MTLIRVLPMSLTKLDELHESDDGDTHQVPRLCTKSSCQDRTGTPWPEEIDIRLTRNDHFWPAAAPIPRPNPWTPKPKREPSSESFREKYDVHRTCRYTMSESLMARSVSHTDTHTHTTPSFWFWKDSCWCIGFQFGI